jgi:hypothetical protein
MFILNWFSKKNKIALKKPAFELEDSLEIALWDIKEKYDLETEEIEQAVLDKRNNINYMNKHTKNNK